MNFPEKAKDTLATIPENIIKNLNQADRAFYTLLQAEARYKNYLPVVNDTSIFRVVEYYRKHGPQDKLARALVIQGAVYEELYMPSLAMESFKEAEPIIESSGNMEQLGLIHIRIGEIYQRSIANIPAAIERYKKAFEQASVAFFASVFSIGEIFTGII